MQLYAMGHLELTPDQAASLRAVGGLGEGRVLVLALLPEAERLVELGQAVKECLDALDEPKGLREYADDGFQEDGGTLPRDLIYAIAAWLEAEKE